MDLFNKAKLRLDSPATPDGLRGLCKLGILRSKDFLNALSLMKDARYWNKMFYVTFMIFAVISIFYSAFNYFYTNWDSYQFFYKILLCQLLFIVSVVASHFIGTRKIVGRLFIVAAIFNIGLMLYIINMRYPLIGESWSMYTEWAALFILWALCLRSSLLWCFLVSLINYAVVLWGYQYGISNGVITWQYLLLSLCVFNLALLVAVEVMTDLFLKKRRFYLWMFLLLISFISALAVAMYRVCLGEIMSFEVLFFAVIAILFSWFYYSKYPKYNALVIIATLSYLYILAITTKITIDLLDIYIRDIYMFLMVALGVIAVQIFVFSSALAKISLLLYKRKEKGLMV